MEQLLDLIQVAPEVVLSASVVALGLNKLNLSNRWLRVVNSIANIVAINTKPKSE